MALNICTNCGLNFLYIKLLVDEMKRNKNLVVNLANGSFVAPRKLEDLYDEMLKFASEKLSHHEALQLLAIVISSGEPLEEGMLIAALQWIYPNEANKGRSGLMRFKQLLRHMNSFLKEEKRQNLTYYQVYHESIREWFHKLEYWDNRQGHAALVVLFARLIWMLAVKEPSTSEASHENEIVTKKES